MNRLLGMFIFKLAENRGLEGRWLNNMVQTLQRETATANGNTDGFTGRFISRWIDDSGECTASLKITQQNDAFNLEWQVIDSSVVFIGVGAIEQGNLVGGYSIR